MKKNICILLGIACLVMLCNIFVCRIAFIYGESMQPTLQEKDCVLVWKFHYTLRQGDIVITNKDNVLSQNLVKRVIAVEGQTIRFDKDSVWVDGVKLEEEYIAQDETIEYEEREFVVLKDEVFLMGDNRNHSKDSREVGCFSKESIEGKVVYKVSL